MVFRLESEWRPGGSGPGLLVLELHNLELHNPGSGSISGFRLAFTALMRAAPGHRVAGARLTRQIASYHEYAPPAGFVLAPAGCWRFEIDSLERAPCHYTDGPAGAFLILAGDETATVETGETVTVKTVAVKTVAVECGPLRLAAKAEKGTPPARGSASGRSLPRAAGDRPPLGLLPWPARCQIAALRPEGPVTLGLATGSALARRALADVAALAGRLFQDRPPPLRFGEGDVPLTVAATRDLPACAYRLVFAADGVTLCHGDSPQPAAASAGHGPAGLFQGLVTLAQLCLGCARGFRFPADGRIADRPRYGWRGSHLDVSRQFYSPASVARFLDLLAWHKMNVLQWHLTDDEGWRLDIPGWPQLTDIGAWRGHGLALPPLFGSGAARYGGFYSREDVAALLRHAAALHIGIVPEIDWPGHSAAALAACPELADPAEPPESYRSVQGYPNNALNPAVPAVYDFVAGVLDAVTDMFPSPCIHLGGDEVPDTAWHASPLAADLARREGLEGAIGLQAWFMRRVQAMLAERGKSMAAWEEAMHGGGVAPDGTCLMAWTSPDAIARAAAAGYDVVVTPGQACYLDMADSEDWNAPGASWAGFASLETCHAFDGTSGVPAAARNRIRGVQAGIWGENLTSRAMFNRMVFPRLSAIAESAWTPAAAKDWRDFPARAKLMPAL